MDIQFGQFSGARDIEMPAQATPLDWPGLMARLTTAYALRQLLASQSGDPGTGVGSFAPAVARGIADRANAGHSRDGYCTGGVNQNAKAIGKSLGPIGGDSKGEDPSAVRGLS